MINDRVYGNLTAERIAAIIKGETDAIAIAVSEETRRISVAQRGTITVHAPLGTPRVCRAGKKGNCLMPPLQEMLHGASGACRVIDHHCSYTTRWRRRTAVHQHHRRIGLAHSVELSVTETRATQDDPVDPLLIKGLEHRPLAGRILLGVAEKDAVAGSIGDVLDTARHIGEERVRHIRHDQSQRAGVARRQAASDTAGTIP